MENGERTLCDIIPLRASAEYEAQLSETVRLCERVAEQLGSTS